MHSGKFILFFVFAILAVHVTAVFQDWYHAIWWMDILLHVAGGAWLALVFFYVADRYALQFWHMPPFIALICMLGFVMLVGVGWEWFEYGFDYFIARDAFVWRAQLGLPDTMGDLLADFTGGLLVAGYGILRMKAISKESTFCVRNRCEKCTHVCTLC